MPEGAILVTADIEGLYPHISHEEGLSAMREALGRLGTSRIPTEDLVNLARIVLTSNLTFNPFIASQLPTTNFSLYNTYKI